VYLRALLGMALALLSRYYCDPFCKEGGLRMGSTILGACLCRARDCILIARDR
jgi:hypothetical protein